MNILSAENLYKTHGEKVLLNEITFGIDEGDKIGLIGVNGTGKSTLLKIVAGVDVPERGQVTVGGRVVVHYLPQEPAFTADKTVLEQVFSGNHPTMQLLRSYEHVLQSLESATEDIEKEKWQKRLLELQASLDAANAWQMDYEAKTVLTRLGITDFQAPVGMLSGGQKKRVALAQALIQPSDLLVLDEPTNHIDNDTVQWLESYLQKRKGALFLVTHDRYFLDRVVNRIFELERGRLYTYPGNYQAFLEGKVQREEEQFSSEEKRQNFLRNELEWIRRGPKARGTKQKARTERYYETLAEDALVQHQAADLSTASTRLGKTVIELQDVHKSYGDRQILRGFSYILLRGDRIGIVGPNGAGKSTLLKLMAGIMEPDSGHVTIGSTVEIGYFSQEHEDLNEDMRVLDYIREEAAYVETADGEHITASQMLERFLFPGPMQWTPIRKLSGGEKRRLALLKTLMKAPNVLLLDEPTNDLDIPTLAVLESYLDDFPGPVVVVSHDRSFLDHAVDKIFAVDGNGQVTVTFGNYSEYTEKLNLTTNVEADVKTHASRAVEAVKPAPTEKKKPLKFTFKEQKEYDEIEDRITEVEQQLERIGQDMIAWGSDVGRLHELHQEQVRLEQQLDNLLERWTYLNELAEQIEQSKKTQ